MTRKDLCLSGGMLLAIGAAVWLWGENRELRGRLMGMPGSEASMEKSESTRANGNKPSTMASPPNRRGESPGTGGLKPQPSRRGPGTGTKSLQKSQAGESVTEAPDLGPDTDDLAKTTDEDEDAAKLLALQLSLPPEVIVISGAEAEKDGISLFKNGGFDKGLDPWTCAEGEVVQERGNPNNPVLEITPREGKYTLSQEFRRSVASRKLTLAFRTKSTNEGLAGITVNVRDENGKVSPIYADTYRFDQGGGWAHLRFSIDWSKKDSRPVGLIFHGSSGSDPVFFDDVVVQEVRSTSFAGGTK